MTHHKELERRKDEFISIASHEFKTPLTTIKIFTQILMQYLAGDKKTSGYLIKVNNQVDQLTNLVNDMLDVSRIQSGKLALQKEEFNLYKLIKEAVEDIQDTTEQQIILTGQQVKIVADKFRINQVIINLLSNAVKYSSRTNPVKVNLSSQKDFISVSVADSGIGIRKSNQKKIFEPFFQSENKMRPSASGLGLGLYISKEIIQRHGGKISVDSATGKGSTFTFNLPKR